MKSIRAKMTILTVCAVVITILITTIFGIVGIKSVGDDSVDTMLYLLCKTGQKNLDSYFDSVQQSVELVSTYADENLKGIDDENLNDQVGKVKNIFAKAVEKTQGVLTYYYRIDTEISNTVSGFWFTNTDGNGFVERQVTDISQYDTHDTTKLVWFTVPKATKKSVWLPPYVTDNLDVYVISYNVPILYNDTFVGVVGIEIDYTTMASQVNNIRLYEKGYAFINDYKGNLIYHPYLDVAQFTEETTPDTPNGVIDDNQYIKYKFNGETRKGVWLPLINGMRLNVTVPVSEINNKWVKYLYQIIAASLVILVVLILLTLRLTSHVTKPLKELTEVAEKVNHEDYDVELNYDRNDEIGILANTFNQLITHLKTYIGDLNSLAYDDALTSTHNKGAFDIAIHDLQDKLDDDKKHEFAICIFDCDDLKNINDKYGHVKGDIYLKTASHTICAIFIHSPVYRIGGDEFAVILQNEAYQKRDELIAAFIQKGNEINASTKAEWAKVRVAYGIAIYDSTKDHTIDDVISRADMNMYENKRLRKENR